MAKEPINIIKTDGEIDQDTAKEIAADIMADINEVKKKNTEQE